MFNTWNKEEFVRKYLILVVLMAICIAIIGCASSRIVKQTETEAIVEGMGFSKAEARHNTETLASGIFKEYTEYKEAEYSEGYQDYGSHGGQTYFVCTMFIRKKF
jgi:hypothetical protein